MVARGGETSSGPREHLRWQIDYVFSLPEPSSFAPLRDAVEPEDERVLRRYVTHARELAGSHVLNTRDVGYTVSFTPTKASVESKLPSSELVRGLALGFRQLYSPDEKASFAAAMRVLQKAIRGERADTMQAQISQLAQWGRTAGKLRSDWLEALAYEQGKSAGSLKRLQVLAG